MPKNALLINVDIGETRVGLLEDGTLGELYIERRRERSPVGNVYLGRVTRVLPGMQAAFVDIGLDRAAFLHVEDLVSSDAGGGHSKRSKGDEADDDEDDAAGAGSGSGDKSDKKADKDSDKKGGNGRNNRVSRKTPIRDVLKEGDALVVQVAKGPIGTKGARVTAHVSLPGRYVVYMPTVDIVGVSKRIGRDKERKRLKHVIEAVKPPTGGIVVRTLAQGLTKKMLKADIGYLVRTWEDANRIRAKGQKPPVLLYEEPDIVLRAARDMFNDGVAEIVIDDAAAYERLRSFLRDFLPGRVDDVKLYDSQEPLFDEYGVEDEINRALSRKVPLPSGGYLIIDQAEALTAIDVNTGRFTGKGADVEDTIFQTNVEAVKEIAYQLRFRNIGGLIVLDFIDMERSAHRDRVYRALQQELKRDKAKTTATRISDLGLVEMTRKRTRESLGRTLFEPCFFCDGTGHLRSKDTICHEIFRQMMRERDSLPGYEIIVSAHPAVCDMLEREERWALDEAAKRLQRRIVLNPRNDYHLEQFDLTAS
ncbi:MAG: Rne/Rng family ribonuclease [Myxococcales bacterium]|nr:Rne/Rng family ribonuclease [Myxococcales bacterium]